MVCPRVHEGLGAYILYQLGYAKHMHSRLPIQMKSESLKSVNKGIVYSESEGFDIGQVHHNTQSVHSISKGVIWDEDVGEGWGGRETWDRLTC